MSILLPLMDPIRIEWFGDEVDSIRTFSVADQRSIEKLDHVLLPPATELFASRESLASAAEKSSLLLDDRLQKVKDLTVIEKMKKTITWEIEQLSTGTLFTGIYKYISLNLS